MCSGYPLCGTYKEERNFTTIDSIERILKSNCILTDGDYFVLHYIITNFIFHFFSILVYIQFILEFILGTNKIIIINKEIK